ncbi:hypothetical protein JCM17960_13140 [Magnetospira thiophila]
MDDITIESPYPLRQLFKRRIIPGLIVFVIVSLGLSWFGVREALRAVYLEQADRRGETIASASQTAQPEAWTAYLLMGQVGQPVPRVTIDKLSEAFSDEVTELALSRLKVYDTTRTIIFDTQPETIGTVSEDESLKHVLQSGDSHIFSTKDEVGRSLYEFYVPVRDPAGRVVGAFELYETVDFLDDLVLRHALLPTLIPGALLVFLVLALRHLVRRAQTNIDSHTEALSRLRRQLETFVSGSARSAALESNGAEIPSRRVTCSVLFSDVRGFTSYAESAEPEQVVAFLNTIMGEQIDLVDRFNGDVDKFIGDAVLARFEGVNASGRAIAAGRAILHRAKQLDLPRDLGIGIYTGEVISGAVGPQKRRDFTVIGDGVNLAARLSDAAAPGEMVVDEATVQMAEAGGFGPSETLRVKGRETALNVRRWRRDAKE